jgi:hypothetical protein
MKKVFQCEPGFFDWQGFGRLAVGFLGVMRGTSTGYVIVAPRTVNIGGEGSSFGGPFSRKQHFFIFSALPVCV